MLASKNKQKAPNETKTIPLQSTSFESSAHLNLIKTVLNPPPCNQGKNLKYARSHLSSLSILTHPLSLTNCLKCLGPYRGRDHITFVFLKAMSQVTSSMQSNANGQDFIITYPNGRNPLLCYLTWIERRNKRWWIKIPSYASPFQRPSAWVDTAIHPQQGSVLKLFSLKHRWNFAVRKTTGKVCDALSFTNIHRIKF